MGFGVVLVFFLLIHSQNNANFATGVPSEHFNLTLKPARVIENIKKGKEKELAK